MNSLEIKNSFHIAINICMKPIALLLAGYLINLSGQTLLLFWGLNLAVKMKISFYFILFINFSAELWFTLNLLSWCHRKFKRKYSNEIWLIFSLPVIECFEGTLSLAKMHYLLPTFQLYYLSTLLTEKLIQGFILLVLCRFIFMTFSRLGKYFEYYFKNPSYQPAKENSFSQKTYHNGRNLSEN